MPSEKKYKTVAAFERAVDKYFSSISRRVSVTEPVATGRYDKYGHEIYNEEPVMSDKGDILTRLEYYQAPTVTSLCLALGICLTTFENYAKREGYREVVLRARAMIRAYLENEIIMRKKGSVKGLEFSLEQNFSDEALGGVESGGSFGGDGADASLSGSLDTLCELLERVACKAGDDPSSPPAAELLPREKPWKEKSAESGRGVSCDE